MKDKLFLGDSVNTSRIIYTPSNFAKSSLLHIQEIGTLQATSPHTSRRSNLESYLFFVVLSGSGLLSYDNTRYELTAGDCAFIDCRKPYYHATGEDLWKLSWIHFYGPTLDNIYDKYVERGGLPTFHSDNLPEYSSICKNLSLIAGSDSYVRDMEINDELSKLLVILMKDAWQQDSANSSTKKNDLVSIKNYLDEHYKEKVALDELAQRYYINKYYLTRIFKEQYGTSINNYLINLRITEAKNQLRFTNKTTEDIGIECGIGPGYYFSRMFAKVEGVSPSEYRKKWR